MTRRPTIDSLIRAAKKHGAVEIILADGTRIRLSGDPVNDGAPNPWDRVLQDGAREIAKRQ